MAFRKISMAKIYLRTSSGSAAAPSGRCIFVAKPLNAKAGDRFDDDALERIPFPTNRATNQAEKSLIRGFCYIRTELLF